MESIGIMTLDTSTLSSDCADNTTLDESISFPDVPRPGERGSEARRRFLFAAAHHGQRNEAHHGAFPGKLAWIAVALFVLGILIALIG